MARLLTILCAASTLAIAVRAQTGSGAAGSRAETSRPTATIDHYEYRPHKDVPLTIYYGDGSTSAVKPECGRQGNDQGCLSQTDFKDIQVSEDRQRIGWAADYMMCAQSYPCSIEVAVLRVGQAPRYFHGGGGIVWRWSFWKGGSQVILHCGFPHGDDKGYFVLFDGDTGRVIRDYRPGRTEPPDWVAYLRDIERSR